MESLTREEWIAFDRAHPAPTFFARPAWAFALADVSPNVEALPIVVRIGRRRLIVPMMRARTRAFRELIAFPLGGYSCVLDENGRDVSAELAHQALASITATTDHLRFVPWPLGAHLSLPGARRREYETAVIDCSKGYEHVLAGVRGVTRRMAGQAQRRGVHCARSERIEDVTVYHAILSDASIGWGLSQPPLSEPLLRAVMTRGGDDAELWFASVDGTAIAGGLVLYGSQELFFWTAAMRRDYGQYRPSNALNLALLRAACDRGLRWYNLGASEGLEGVARFKSDLGAQALRYPAFEWRRPAFAMYERVRRAFPMRSA